LAFFGGVPRSILYDNTKIAVARITGAGERVPTLAFTGLKSHFLFESRFGRPGKGNDKGKVEGLVKYARRNFMTPIPEARSFDEFNARLAEQCLKRQAERVDRRPDDGRPGGLSRHAQRPLRGLREAAGPRLLDILGALSQ
jgi:transposase